MELFEICFKFYFMSVVGILFSTLALSKNLTENISVEEVNPYSPKILCSLLPPEFIVCNEPLFAPDLANSTTSEFICPEQKEKKYRYENVSHVSVRCHVVDDSISCAGDRNFTKSGFPCVRYTGYCFITIFLQSVFLGCLGVDRFSLGLTGTAVGKLLTLGGVGVWWFVDIILLLTGNLGPVDNSNWCIYY